MVKIFRFDNDTKEFSANTYIIGKIGSFCLVVDLGSTSKEIYEYIDNHYDRCLGVLLTHAHFDHIRGLTKFLRHFNYDIPVYLSEADLPLLTDSTSNFSKSQGEDVKVNIDPVTVKDGDELVFKKEMHVKVIATPFHTEGSVCYLFDDDNALFSGDTLFKDSIGRSDLATSDPDKVIPSLKKLMKLRDTLVVYPGHGDITRLGEEKKNNPFLKQL